MDFESIQTTKPVSQEVVEPDPSLETEAMHTLDPDGRFGDGFEAMLGPGFDKEFFADKLQTFPQRKMFEGWNAFLLAENEDLHDRVIEFGTLTTLIDTVTRQNTVPLMFPVFVQGVQSYNKSEGVPIDHITPERMQRFYECMEGAGASPPETHG